MTNLQESRLSMYLAFRDFQAANTAITNPLPNYTTNSTTFINTITQIQAIAEQQKMSKKGIANNKNNLRNALIVLTADNSRKMVAYAKFTNNPTLEKEVQFAESKLKRVADTSVKDYAQIVYDRAQPIVATLAAYGITTATQTAFLAAINNYNASIGKPRAGATEKSQFTKQLATLFKTADAALFNMDTAVEIVRLSQVNFYNGYKTARKIVETGNGKLSVKGLVVEASNGVAIKGAKLAFVLDGKAIKAANAQSIVKKTAVKGGFSLKSLPAGIYNVTISKNGYQEQIVSLAVSDGERSELKVQLSKN
jgi:hypothetical protein